MTVGVLVVCWTNGSYLRKGRPHDGGCASCALDKWQLLKYKEYYKEDHKSSNITLVDPRNFAGLPVSCQSFKSCV